MTIKNEEQMMNEITRHMQEFSQNLEETKIFTLKLEELSNLICVLPEEKAVAAMRIVGEIMDASVKAAFKGAKEAERVAELYSK